MTAGQRMPNADAAWLRMDSPTNLMIINGVLLFDEPMDRDRIERVLRERLLDHFPRFRQRVTEGSPLRGPAWEDDPTFDIRSHVHRVGLPAPGDDAALEELMGDLMAVPLDRSKPLWHAYLIDGFGSGCALIMRMHHCIADGIALARVMMMLSDEHAADFVSHGRHTATPLDAVLRPASSVLDVGRTLASAFVREGFEVVHDPGHLGQIASATAGDLRSVYKLLAAPPDAPTPLKGELGVTRRVAWTRHIALPRVKAIGRTHGVTLNDVLVSALTGALHRHLDKLGSFADELHAMVPFNLRPLDQPLDDDLGNRFGLVLLALPVGINDPVDRLDEVARRMAEIKGSHEGQIAYGILSIIGMTPASVEGHLIDMFSSKATLVCTNVPGPRKMISVDGVGVRDVLVWAPTSGSVGLGVSIFSYAGHVVTGFMAAESVVEDPRSLARAYEVEISALQHAPATAPA